MSKEKQSLFSFDPAPTNLPDMADVMGQFQDAIRRAFAIPAEDFPTDKEMRITWGCKAILVPEVSCHFTRKEQAPIPE